MDNSGYYKKYEVFKLSPYMRVEGRTFVLEIDKDPDSIAILRGIANSLSPERIALKADLLKFANQFESN